MQFYVEKNIKKLNDKRIKKVFIYRDLRDQIVSAAFWIKTIERAPQHEWSLDELIDALIIDGERMVNNISCTKSLDSCKRYSVIL